MPNASPLVLGSSATPRVTSKTKKIISASTGNPESGVNYADDGGNRQLPKRERNPGGEISAR